jgi:hypothetical protein
MIALAAVTLLSVYLATETSREGLDRDVATQQHD